MPPDVTNSQASGSARRPGTILPGDAGKALAMTRVRRTGAIQQEGPPHPVHTGSGPSSSRMVIQAHAFEIEETAGEGKWKIRIHGNLCRD